MDDSELSLRGPTEAPTALFAMDTRRTRYHVVRVAAVSLNWDCMDGGPASAEKPSDASRPTKKALTGPIVPVPYTFRGWPCRRASLSPTAAPTQFIWQDKSIVPEVLPQLRPYQRINHFLDIQVIARKAQLAKRIMKLLRCRLRPVTSSSRLREQLPPQVEHALRSASEATVQQLTEALMMYFPESFSTLSEIGALEDFLVRKKESAQASPSTKEECYFIIKPNTSCEGRGIRVTKNPLEDFTEDERERKIESVVQVYVDRPLLLHHRKFDLRIYVLLTSVMSPGLRRLSVRAVKESTAKTEDDINALAAEAPEARAPQIITDRACDPLAGIQLFVHDRGLVRLCALPYEPPSEKNRQTREMHLSNYAVNKSVNGFSAAPVGVEATKGAAPHFAGDEANKYDLCIMEDVINRIPSSELDPAAMQLLYEKYGGCADAEAPPSRWSCVQRAIDDCIALTMLSGMDPLRRACRPKQAVMEGQVYSLTPSFELLGFDIMLRERTLMPVLIEVNHSPSLFCETELDFEVKRTVLTDLFQFLEATTPTREECRSNIRYEKAMERKLKKLQADPSARFAGWRQLITEVPLDAEKSEASWRAAQQEKYKLMVRVSQSL